MKKINWSTISKISNIVSLLAGIVFFIQLILSILTKVSSGVPFWLFISTSFTCLILGLFLGLSLFGKKIFKLTHEIFQKISCISFDYLPDIPTNHGWKIDFDGPGNPQEKKLPAYLSATDSPVAGAISIEHKDRYYLDYLVSQQESLANLVEYYVKPDLDGTFYLKLSVTSRDKSQSKTVWLNHIIGKGSPRKISNIEWSISIQGEILENGWSLVKLSIEDEVIKTFGTNGFIYEKLIGIRLRGSLSLGAITFYYISTKSNTNSYKNN